MSEIAKIAVLAGLGLASGFVFFGLLDRLNARLAERAEQSQTPRTAAIAATLVLRFVLLAAILFVSIRTGIGYLFVTFAGFMVARAVCLHLLARKEEE
jgi:hypothetical protein